MSQMLSAAADQFLPFLNKSRNDSISQNDLHSRLQAQRRGLLAIVYGDDHVVGKP